MQDLRVDELAAHVSPVFFARGGRSAIEGDVSSLRTDHDLVACRSSGSDQLLNGGANAPLGSLAAIVDRGVDQVNAGGDCRLDGGFIRGVVSVGAFAEVCADAEGRDAESRRGGTIKVGKKSPGEAVAESAGAGVGRAQARDVDGWRRGS